MTKSFYGSLFLNIRYPTIGTGAVRNWRGGGLALSVEDQGHKKLAGWVKGSRQRKACFYSVNLSI